MDDRPTWEVELEERTAGDDVDELGELVPLDWWQAYTAAFAAGVASSRSKVGFLAEHAREHGHAFGFGCCRRQD